MVSPFILEEKFNQVRRNFCFYLDLNDHDLAKSLSRRIQDIGLQQEAFLTSRVTHVVKDREVPSAEPPAKWARPETRRARADAMLERVRTEQELTTELKYTQLSVPKAIALLDKLYDTFFAAPQKRHVRLFTKPYIKIEFLDNNWRPIFKEFDEWPSLSLEPYGSRGSRREKEKDKRGVIESNVVTQQSANNTIGQKMTRKSRPRIKEKDEKEPKAGYCEMCNTDYADAILHRRSPHHLAFVRDHTNFMTLDSLIGEETNVKAFLDKTSPVNGERRSLRKICNGDSEPKRRSKRSQSPDSTVNGDQSPKRNGIDEDKKRKRISRKDLEESQYYKVVGVSTKLRSSGGFGAKKKESPTCNGTKPLVVKFKKIRRSELSVLSDEAEQFMFPKRASSSSSTSSTDDEKVLSPKQKSPVQPPLSLERQRLARPLALKEESSEEDSWPDQARKRKRKGAVVAKRTRRVPKRIVFDSKPVELPKVEVETTVEDNPAVEPEVSPLREVEETERCMKWEDGRLKYTPAVEKLEFAFESLPLSEPWFSTFKRQDKNEVSTRNIPRYFELYKPSTAVKLPYEIGQLPPLKPNCCPLSDLIKRDDKAGPARSYGTRGMKKQRMTKKRLAAILALEGQPRKSPREHASTLAILGSAGLLHRRKNTEDTKSTASEDTVSETLSNMKVEPVISETHEVSERLQQFLSEVFEDAADYELSEDAIEGDAAVTTSTNLPDVLSLVSDCENCDIIRKDIQERSANRVKSRRGRLKKNKTGWPKKKKLKGSRANSLDTEHKNESSMDGSSMEPVFDETTQDTISEANSSETENKTMIEDKTMIEEKPKLEELHESTSIDVDNEDSLQLSIVKARNRKHKRTSRSSASDEEDRPRKKSRIMHGMGEWLQPVVRVARVDPNAARQLRSSASVTVNRTRTNRTR